jgi:hypothetical protein
LDTLDVIQKSQEEVDVRSRGVLPKIGELVEVKNLVLVSTHDEDDKITDPSCEPAECLLSSV